MLKNENYEKLYAVGLALSVFLIAAVSVVWAGEGSRMETRVEELQRESISRGHILYLENCITCHGGRGEGVVGPALNNKVLLEEATNEVLFAAIKAGRSGTTMPAWGQEHGGPLTNEDIQNVVNFIRSWESDAPVVEEEVFEPSAERGAAIFASACFVCHGENGLGSTAPAINNPLRLNSLDNEWYRHTIMNGRPAKDMPTWGGVLSPNQIEDLLALIDAWREGKRVIPETTVAELLNSAVFVLSQGDVEDTLFYLDRAKPLAFGPALELFDATTALIENGNLDEGLIALDDLRSQWPTGDAESGAQVFKDNCLSCHGAEGEGGVGVRLNPSEFVQENSNADLLVLLLNGRPDTVMEGFGDHLSEVQLADVIAFLREWQP